MAADSRAAARPSWTRSAAASAARVVRPRTGPGVFRGRIASSRRASSIRNRRDCSSLQCCAASTSDQNAPAASLLSGRVPRSRAPMPNSIRPRCRSAAACSSAQGNGARSGSHASSSCESSRPLIARGSKSLATACSRGSPGVARPSSNCSSRSRHQARRMAPSRGSLLVDTTSANARSRFHSAAIAGRMLRGSCSSATSRS